MIHTHQQLKYYMSVCVLKITDHFNAKKKKWFFVKVWTREITHNWMKRYYFSDRSTKEIEYDEWEEIMKKIREDFSRDGLWISEPNGSNEAPVYN